MTNKNNFKEQREYNISFFMKIKSTRNTHNFGGNTFNKCHTKKPCAKLYIAKNPWIEVHQ